MQESIFYEMKLADWTHLANRTMFIFFWKMQHHVRAACKLHVRDPIDALLVEKVQPKKCSLSVQLHLHFWSYQRASDQERTLRAPKTPAKAVPCQDSCQRILSVMELSFCLHWKREIQEQFKGFPFVNMRPERLTDKCTFLLLVGWMITLRSSQTEISFSLNFPVNKINNFRLLEFQRRESRFGQLAESLLPDYSLSSRESASEKSRNSHRRKDRQKVVDKVVESTHNSTHQRWPLALKWPPVLQQFSRAPLVLALTLVFGQIQTYRRPRSLFAFE